VWQADHASKSITATCDIHYRMNYSARQRAACAFGPTGPSFFLRQSEGGLAASTLT
jgi:hypothetical protein